MSKQSKSKSWNTPEARDQRQAEQKARVEAALSRLVELFESGRLPDALVRIAIRRGKGHRPSDSWSLNNLLIMLSNGTDDARGYGQWQEVGRQVRKGAQGFDILRPVTIKTEDPETGDEGFRVVGFAPVRVFPIDSTDIADQEKWEKAQAGTTYTPPVLPPLFDVAQALGVRVEWTARSSGYWGWYAPQSQQIRLFTHDPLVFWHELAHHVDALVQGGLRTGQDPIQEIVAETASACLGILFRTEAPETEGGLAQQLRYIRHYCPPGTEPHKAVQQVAERVSKVLLRIVETADSLQGVPA